MISHERERERERGKERCIRVILFRLISGGVRENGIRDLKFVFVSRKHANHLHSDCFGENPIFDGRIHQREIDQHKN